MTITPFTKTEVLQYIPQQNPFRFIDDILTLDENSISGIYTFKPNEVFYAGHFPQKPITPGVILLETMAQTGVVALGIYLLSREMDRADFDRMLIMFADAEVEFMKSVYPGDTVNIVGQKIFWRRKKIRSKVELHDSKGELIASATLSGMGVLK